MARVVIPLVAALLLTVTACAAPSPAECTAAAVDAPFLAAAGDTDVFGDIVLIGTITESELHTDEQPPIGGFDLEVDTVLRGDAAESEPIYYELDDGLSLLLEEDELYVVSARRQLDGRLRLVGCEGIAATRRIDNAEAARLRAIAENAR